MARAMPKILTLAQLLGYEHFVNRRKGHLWLRYLLDIFALTGMVKSDSRPREPNPDLNKRPES
jgi:hypothetical protein